HQRHGGDREIDALNPQGQIAGREAKQHADCARAQDLDENRHAERFKEKRGGIGACTEKGGSAKVGVAGVAAEYVPAGGDHHILQHDVAGIEIVGIRHQLRQKEPGHEDQQRQHCESRHRHRAAPNSPVGFRASVASSMAKATPGAQDGLMKLMTSDSAMPIMMPAASVPGMVPMPARTTMAKTRPIWMRPAKGSIGPVMTSAAPAIAASAVAMPKAWRLIVAGLMPETETARSSCATARMARPMFVRLR